MDEYAKLALLPEGLHDDLPPRAAHEALTIERLMDRFSAHGYDRVKPPLLEFEDSLLTGPGARVSRHMFRLMDPISQRMMGLRADMTTQVARIASTRLGRLPRPLRLCYAGQVLRVRGTQLRPERQFAQAGAELIGPASVDGDAEVMLLAAEALREVGVGGLSIDLTVPALVPLLCAELGLDGEPRAAVRHALEHKDRAALNILAPRARELLTGLIDAAGRAPAALASLDRLALPPAAAAICAELKALVALIAAGDSGLVLTIDPGESRDFEYESGISFTLFARGVRGELGRGGRYELATGEPATGFTVYLDSVMRAVPKPAKPRKLYLPHATDAGVGRRLREEGWRTVRGLDPKAVARDEAKRLGCTHRLDGDEIVELS